MKSVIGLCTILLILLLFKDKGSDSGDIYETSQLLLPDSISKTNYDKIVKLDYHDNHKDYHDNHNGANQVRQNHKFVHHGNQNEFKMTALSRTINHTTATMTTTTTPKPTTTG